MFFAIGPTWFVILIAVIIIASGNGGKKSGEGAAGIVLVALVLAAGLFLGMGWLIGRLFMHFPPGMETEDYILEILPIGILSVFAVILVFWLSFIFTRRLMLSKFLRAKYNAPSREGQVNAYEIFRKMGKINYKRRRKP